MNFWDWLWHATFGLASTVFIGWILWRWLKASDEPLVLVVRWIVTLVVLLPIFAFAARAKNEYTMIGSVLLGAVGGIIMIFVWRQPFCNFVADQFTALYTGGSAPTDPTPLYSIAQARRKQGRYEEAIEEVRSQLDRFPTDFTGWMLIAEIQAEDMKDLEGAKQTIDEILSQQGHAPKNFAYALNREADWHLKFNHDSAAARAAFERIVELLPDTEQAQLALQRIARLGPAAKLEEEQAQRKFLVQPGVENLGLRETPRDLIPADEDPGTTAANYVRHLEEFPYDNDSREKLALIYARHYQRLDMASDQLEQLIEFPNQPAKQVVHWLNLLADLQIELGSDPASARITLQRIIELYPKSAAAETALTRMAYLKLEMRPKQQSQAIKLGSYEENIGLKRGPFGKTPAE